MELCDLHTHTTASDGSFTPSQLVDYAFKKKAAAIAITDHDTIDGLDEGLLRAKEIGQKVIPGIEITTNIDGCEVHIIGLFIDYKDPTFAKEVRIMAKTRDERNYKMIEKLESFGLNIHQNDLDRFKGCILTKAHIGAILIERGYASDLKEAMRKYMNKGTIGYVARKVPEAQKCIKLIHEAKGLAFVAHTNQIDKIDREHSIEICKWILENGADGLETRYSEFDDDWNTRTDMLADQYHKLHSGGSDFHGKFKKGLDLITGYGNLVVPQYYLNDMENYLKNDKNR